MMAKIAGARGYRAKVTTLESARRTCRAAQRRGLRVVFTNGCFDLLHPGHVRYLAAARAAGDLLVVAINGDRSVRRLKGPGRPVQHQAARAEVLAALEAVDLVVTFHDDTPIEAILALRPDVLVKGADWKAEEIVGGHEVQARGGRVLRIGLVAGQSTTRLVARSRGEEASARRAAAAPDVAERSGKQLRPSRRPSSSTR